jgi:hypothetical protein
MYCRISYFTLKLGCDKMNPIFENLCTMTCVAGTSEQLWQVYIQFRYLLAPIILKCRSYYAAEIRVEETGDKILVTT